VSQEFRQHAGRRRALGPARLACAISGAATVLSLVFSGCLNPRPEELPSSQAPEGPGAPGDDNLFAPRPSETCDDNSLLGGCAAPAGIGESDTDGADDEPASEPEDSPIDLNRNGQDAGTFAGEAGVGLDAGVGGDAGAP
jgi:hypothetical protein